MTWAVEQELPALQKLVLLMLANCCNHHTGQCNPSHDHLAKECGMSKTAVKDALRALADKGKIEVQSRVQDGVCLPNQYMLKIDGGVGRQATTNQEVKPGNETGKAKRAARPSLTLGEWLSSCKAGGEKPIPESDPVFDYADKQKLPLEYVRYAWLEFRRKYGDGAKKQKDWRAHFRNAVRENWYSIWFLKDGDFVLTTRGLQIQREHAEAA